MPTANAQRPQTKIKSYVLEYRAAEPQSAYSHFVAKLSVETDPSDVYEDIRSRFPGILVVDTRSPESYAKGHLPGAINLWHRTIDAVTAAQLPKDKVLVTYCTGVGCNASTKGAAKLTELGFRVKEMTGGFEWWKQEGYPVETEA